MIVICVRLFIYLKKKEIRIVFNVTFEYVSIRFARRQQFRVLREKVLKKIGTQLLYVPTIIIRVY